MGDDRESTETKKSESFKTPDEAAALDDVLEPAELVDLKDDDPPKKTVKHRFSKFKPSWPPSNREAAIIGAIVVLIGGGLSYTIYQSVAAPKLPGHVKHGKYVPPKPKTEASNLTGLQVDPSVNKRPVTGIMIENSIYARPQSGLADAGVVFEAIAEGGITRFLALYQDTTPGDVGPVRSARPYYVQWSMGFDAGYAHVGGSPAAIADIRAWGVRDLDQFYNSGAYHRISSRPAPHNVYTSLAALNQLETAKGYTSSNYTSLARQKSKPAKVPTAKTIDLRLSGPNYNVHYDYNAKTNSYDRSVGGAAHIDASGSRQISPAVVVAMVVQYGIAADGHHSEYQTIGSGTVYIFQDGTVTTGTWAKTDEKSQITFADAKGKPLALIPGQTWFTAVGLASYVTYAP